MSKKKPYTLTHDKICALLALGFVTGHLFDTSLGIILLMFTAYAMCESIK
jgi:hypothetical protein